MVFFCHACAWFPCCHGSNCFYPPVRSGWPIFFQVAAKALSLQHAITKGQAMYPHLTESHGGNGCYFDRTPEKLVLEGYRRWTAGFETGSVIAWEMAFGLYSELLGSRNGNRALSELSYFIRTLRHCALCPLKTFPFGSHHVCREECLTLGLIAGLQNCDMVAARTCLNAMACPSRQEDVENAAITFAETLVELDQVLLPIPKFAIDDIISRPQRASLH